MKSAAACARRGPELQVTGYQCVDAKTAEILQEIIRETTNRINRMQKQESENDVPAHSWPCGVLKMR